jgi:hypothetical protein
LISLINNRTSPVPWQLRAFDLGANFCSQVLVGGKSGAQTGLGRVARAVPSRLVVDSAMLVWHASFCK